MQTDHRSFQSARKLGLPSSPACTRPRRDAPSIEGHSRAQSQPIVFPPVRPLRPHRHITSESVSVSTSAVHVPKLTSRLEPRHVGSTFATRSGPLSTRQSSTSESSTSSTSFQGRMKGALSQRSSFTSLEDEPEESKIFIGTLQTKSPLFLRPHEVPDLQHNNRYMSVSGFGDSMWDCASAAANTLEVDVTKAWTSTINASEEEETSHGCDSHLVRVMKAYHLAKASHLSDLPDWLFDERERIPSLSSRFAESPRGVVADVPPPGTSFPHIYNEAASRAPQHSRRALHGHHSSGKTGPSNAADRIKTSMNTKRADFGVHHVSSKSENLSCSPSRVNTSVDARHGTHRGANPTRQPLQTLQQLRPGAF